MRSASLLCRVTAAPTNARVCRLATDIVLASNSMCVYARNLSLPGTFSAALRPNVLCLRRLSSSFAVEELKQQRAAHHDRHRLQTYHSWLVDQIRCALTDCEKEFSATFPYPTLPKYVDKLRPWRLDPPWPESEIPVEFHAARAAWQLKRTEWLQTKVPSLLAAEMVLNGNYLERRSVQGDIDIFRAALAKIGRTMDMKLSDEAQVLMLDICHTFADAGNGGGGFQEGDSRATALQRAHDDLLAAVRRLDSKGGCDRKLRSAIDNARDAILGHF
jgi:hypothetical protein